MLVLTIDSIELFDEKNQEFIKTKQQSIQLEHSLVSISKWEANWCKPFLGKESKTLEETIDYIRCMTITPNVAPEIYYRLSDSNLVAVSKYIDKPMTATVFSKQDKTINRETITSEIIYFWMISLNIPVEFQKWHLNRLLALINVINIKNQPPKKMAKNELLSRNAAINEARKRELKTTG